MHAHTRAIVAASAHAVLTGHKVVGIYDHAADTHRRIAAECRGNRLQAFDGDRSAQFGGTLPDLYDQNDKTVVTLEIDGAIVRGYDRATSGFYEARVTDRLVDLYDHRERAWFAYHVQHDGPDAAAS